MLVYEYLMKAVQDDARRAGERGRLLREARRARRARRQYPVPAAPARRRTETGKIVVSESVTPGGVIQDPAGDEGFRTGGWTGLIGKSTQLAKLALSEALAAAAFLLGPAKRRAARRPVAIPQRQTGAQAEQPAQVRRVRDPRQYRLNNPTVLRGDVPSEVPILKQRIDGVMPVVGTGHDDRDRVNG